MDQREMVPSREDKEAGGCLYFCQEIKNELAEGCA